MKKDYRYGGPILTLLLAMPAMGLAQSSPTASGRVLVLDNGRAMQGQIARQGDRYRIRQESGSLWLPADRVVFVGQTPSDAVAFIRRQVNVEDPDERIRVSRWCQQNGFYAEAVKELEAAAALAPGDRRVSELLRSAQRLAAIASRPAAPRASRPSPPPPPSFDLEPESMNRFVAKIQPILMNACARCHARGDGHGFPLRRVFGGGNRLATQHNLATVMRAINIQDSKLSPLLIKAVSAHGNATRPPIGSRRDPPYRLLHDWVTHVLSANPHLRLRLAKTVKRITAEPAVTPAAAQVPTVKQRGGGFAVDAAAGKTTGVSETRSQPRILPTLAAKPLAGRSDENGGKARSVDRYPTRSRPTSARRVSQPTRVLPSPVFRDKGRRRNAAKEPIRTQQGIPVRVEPPPPEASPMPTGDVFDPAPFNRTYHPDGKKSGSTGG